MRIAIISLIAVLFASCLGGEIPRVAPSKEEIAGSFALAPGEVEYARSNMDPILARDHGVRWRYSYYLHALSKNALLQLSVLSPKHVPAPSEGVGDPKKAIEPQRRIVESNGDVVFLYSCRVDERRSEHVIRVERHQGDWDLLLQIVADDSAKTANAAFFEDTALRACSGKIERILTKSMEPASLKKVDLGGALRKE